MPMNPYVGWGVSSLLLWLVNKGSGSSDQTDPEPSDLSISETKVGTPVPVVLGRTLVKSLMPIYYGDFSAKAYTETYAAHAKFPAWPMILQGLLMWATAPVTGKTVDGTEKPHKHLSTEGETGPPTQEHGHGHKEKIGPEILMMFAQWILMWLINGRNLKTTMQKGFKYYLGYQQLVCWSAPGMRLRVVYLGQNKVWEGDVSRESLNGQPFVIKINDDELFGGPDEGGGFSGELHVYLGGENQMPDPWMVQQMHADTVQEELRGLTPAYRPFVSIVVPTAYVGKQATIPETWVELQYCPNGLGLGQIDEDANPAELLHEIHVNSDWGLSESQELLDLDSLITVGQKLKTEKLGLAVPISQTGQARSIVDSICEHVNMVRYIDPRTGKLVYKLIRDDYDAATIPIINEKNCNSVNYSRLDWYETISEISVSYTDRQANYEQSSISDNDPANIEINNGAKTTKSYDYSYFTNAENALWAVKRELRQQGYPLASVTIEGNRTLAAYRTGEVLCLNWPPYGITNMLIRITEIDIGDFIDGSVKIEAIEDVFGLEKTEFGFSGSTEWKYGANYPSGVQYLNYMELPWELQQEKDSFVVAMAVRPDAKTMLWQVWRKQGEEWEKTSAMTQWTAAGRLSHSLDKFGAAEDLDGFEVEDLGGIDELPQDPDNIVTARKGGNILVIGSEIMAYSTLVQLPNGHFQVKGIIRGIFDTVPVDHAPGEVIYFLEPGTYTNVLLDDPVAQAGLTSSGTYNITTASGDADEEFDPKKARSITTYRRSERPNPPGCFRMSAHLMNNEVNTETLVGDLQLTWVPRSKLTFGAVSQDDQVNYWSGLAFEAPEGMDYIMRIYVGTEMVATYAEVEPHFTYTWAQRCRNSRNLTDQTRIVLRSRMNGLESHQAQERVFEWKMPFLADGCASAAEAFSRLSLWGSFDRFVVPAGVSNSEYYVLYQDMPVLIIGEKFDTPVLGSIECQDGKWIIANGQMLVINGQNSGNMVQMHEGFTLKQFGRYYRWYGDKLAEVQIGG